MMIAAIILTKVIRVTIHLYLLVTVWITGNANLVLTLTLATPAGVLLGNMLGHPQGTLGALILSGSMNTGGYGSMTATDKATLMHCLLSVAVTYHPRNVHTSDLVFVIATQKEQRT